MNAQRPPTGDTSQRPSTGDGSLRPGDGPQGPTDDPQGPSPSDAELMERIATGDRSTRNAAFHELVERHRGRVHAICYRYFRDPTDAEDATQETFLTVLRRAGTFRGEAQVSTWMYRVAVNTCHDMARHRARRPQTPVADIGLVSDLHEAHSDEDELAALELSDVLREALETLDEETRGLLVLCTIEQVPYAEVAEAYGIAVGTVKSRVHRARAKLVELLGGFLDPEEGSASEGSERPGPPRNGSDPPPSVRGPPT